MAIQRTRMGSINSSMRSQVPWSIDKDSARREGATRRSGYDRIFPTFFGWSGKMTTTLAILITLTLFVAPHWTVQTSGVNVRLRGVSAVSENVAWASGAGSTVL